MAAVVSLAGGVFGFVTALASLVVLDASVWLALAIWSGSGIGVVILGLGWSLMTRPAPAPDRNNAATRAHLI